jgi:hypothetical protein
MITSFWTSIKDLATVDRTQKLYFLEYANSKGALHTAQWAIRSSIRSVDNCGSKTLWTYITLTLNEKQMPPTVSNITVRIIWSEVIVMSQQWPLFPTVATLCCNKCSGSCWLHTFRRWPFNVQLQQCISSITLGHAGCIVSRKEATADWAVRAFSACTRARKTPENAM